MFFVVARHQDPTRFGVGVQHRCPCSTHARVLEVDSRDGAGAHPERQGGELGHNADVCRRELCTYAFGITWRERRLHRERSSVVEVDQTIVTTSTAEFELAEAVEAHLQVRNIALLLAELNQRVDCFSLASDNTATPSMAWRTRHISIRGHLCHQALLSSDVKFYYVGRTDQKADAMTKGLSHEVHL